MKPLVVIRPQPGCDATVAAARALGLEAHGFPLFTIEPRQWQVPEPETIDALLIGSANALRYGGHQLGHLRHLPVLAVGETTAQAARETGFRVLGTGQGGLHSLLDQLPPGYHRLLRLAGEDRVVLSPPAGVTLTECIVYAARSLAMPAALARLLRGPAVVVLHSAEAARHFAGECQALNIDRRHISLAALAPRVGEAVGLGWAGLAISSSAQDGVLLELVSGICKA